MIELITPARRRAQSSDLSKKEAAGGPASLDQALALACLAFGAKSQANGLLAMAAARRRRRGEIEPPPPRADLWTTYTVVNVLFISVYAALVGTLLESDATGKLALASVGWSPFLLGGSLFALGGIITLRDLARRP